LEHNLEQLLELRAMTIAKAFGDRSLPRVIKSIVSDIREWVVVVAAARTRIAMPVRRFKGDEPSAIN